MAHEKSVAMLTLGIGFPLKKLIQLWRNCLGFLLLEAEGICTKRSVQPTRRPTSKMQVKGQFLFLHTMVLATIILVAGPIPANPQSPDFKHYDQYS